MERAPPGPPQELTLWMSDAATREPMRGAEGGKRVRFCMPFWNGVLRLGAGGGGV